MQIKPRKTYRIKGNSKYFKKKYGTSNPLIKIENTDYVVFGGSWAFQNGNPACMLYGMRSAEDDLPSDIIDKQATWYGKVHGLGELVHKSELAEVKKK